jgi:Domain of unknown function (DUF4082)
MIAILAIATAGFLVGCANQVSMSPSRGLEDGSTNGNLFTLSNTPATVTVNDHGAVELGVKFQSSVAGRITGIRFYKGPQNLGVHTAHLWTCAGALLASATFSDETGSGWQQVNFATPVAIAANTVYVASYYAPLGLYSANGNYFANARVSGVLTAPANAGSGGNGVYAYSAMSKFPNSTYNATNYWVDVVLQLKLSGTAISTSGTLAAENRARGGESSSSSQGLMPVLTNF